MMMLCCQHAKDKDDHGDVLHETDDTKDTNKCRKFTSKVFHSIYKLVTVRVSMPFHAGT